jgi:hypothetical protein
MVIKKKLSKERPIEIDADDAVFKVINRGGKVSVEDAPKLENREIRFTMRLPNGLLKKIDTARQTNVGKVSRNQFIVEMLHKALKR